MWQQWQQALQSPKPLPWHSFPYSLAYIPQKPLGYRVYLPHCWDYVQYLPQWDTQRQQDAIALARLTITTATGMAILFTVILYFTADQLLAIFNAQALGALVYLLPFAMLSSTLSAVLAQWLIREHAYGITARFEVATALLLGTAKSSMGAIAPSASALILVNILGGLTGTLLTFWGWLKSPAKEQRLKNAQKSIDPETRKGMAALAREYRDFPLYRTPQNFINMASQSLPIIMLAAYFGPSASGQYSIAISLLGIPTALISVFYPRVTEAVHNQENVRQMIIKATAGMALIGFIPYSIVVAFGPSLFVFVFGPEWQDSGHYAQWLAPWLFLQYLNRPAVAAIPSLGLQKGLLIYEIFSTGTKVIALWAGFVVYGSAVVSIALFSLSGITAYIWLILWVIYRSPKTDTKTNQGS